MEGQIGLWITILYALVIIGFALVMIVALLKVQTGHSKSLHKIFQQTQFLQLATVLVIIISATYLQFAGILSDGIVAIFSGIAGYVLGGLRDKKGAEGSNEPQ